MLYPTINSAKEQRYKSLHPHARTDQNKKHFPTVRNREAKKVDRHILLALNAFMEEDGDLDTGNSSFLKGGKQLHQRVSGIDDVFHEQNMLILETLQVNT